MAGGRRGALEAFGVLTLIWRADARAEVLATLTGDFGDVTVLPVYPRADAPPNLHPGAGGQRRSGRPPGRDRLVLNDGSGRPPRRLKRSCAAARRCRWRRLPNFCASRA